MRDGIPSQTARRVAAYRLGFARPDVAGGNPLADDALARDVAGDQRFEPVEPMARYLQARTAFFDRVVVDALDRGVTQLVAVGAGYDGRALRFARPGVSWWEVDHPDTQADKRTRLRGLGLGAPDITFVPLDLEAGGLAASLVDASFEPDAPSLFWCEGVALYLSRTALAGLVADLRSLAAPDTRLAVSLPTRADAPGSRDRRARLEATLASLGEPVVSSMDDADLADFLAGTRWRPVDVSERARNAGLLVLAPV